jgi:serine phosphatase RsbU (regulator of sigma subunit)
VQEVGEHGLVLGADPELEVVESTSVLQPADCVLFYTDGLTEAYAPGRTPAQGDLQSVLESHASSSSDEIAEDLYRTMLEFSSSEPRDDVALVVLRIIDHAPPARGSLPARYSLESRT